MTTRYLHTMYRITDPDRSRTFYEALGLEFRSTAIALDRTQEVAGSSRLAPSLTTPFPAVPPLRLSASPPLATS
jgi:catechol 2,3-dioxygenase-like lactoylglutathione lyase family enzyme